MVYPSSEKISSAACSTVDSVNKALIRESFQHPLRESRRARDYGVTNERLCGAAENAVVMHPGPMNEGVEISAGVAHGPRSLIRDQVTNGVAVRMAVLYLLAASSAEEARLPGVSRAADGQG